MIYDGHWIILDDLSLGWHSSHGNNWGKSLPWCSQGSPQRAALARRKLAEEEVGRINWTKNGGPSRNMFSSELQFLYVDKVLGFHLKLSDVCDQMWGSVSCLEIDCLVPSHISALFTVEGWLQMSSELVDGNIYPYVWQKHDVSCRFSLKSAHWMSS
jgi:hypothetical protein